MAPVSINREFQSEVIFHLRSVKVRTFIRSEKRKRYAHRIIANSFSRIYIRWKSRNVLQCHVYRITFHLVMFTCYIVGNAVQKCVHPKARGSTTSTYSTRVNFTMKSKERSESWNTAEEVLVVKSFNIALEILKWSRRNNYGAVRTRHHEGGERDSEKREKTKCRKLFFVSICFIRVGTTLQKLFPLLKSSIFR